MKSLSTFWPATSRIGTVVYRSSCHLPQTTGSFPLTITSIEHRQFVWQSENDVNARSGTSTATRIHIWRPPAVIIIFILTVLNSHQDSILSLSNSGNSSFPGQK